MLQNLIVVILSQEIRRAGHHVDRVYRVRVYWSFVVSAMVETIFSHLGAISNEALRKFITHCLNPSKLYLPLC